MFSGANTIAGKGHTWGAVIETTKPTCATPGQSTQTCTACGEKKTAVISALGHAWGEWAVTTKAVCGVDGVETRECANDKTHKETRPIKTANIVHEWWLYDRVYPTCQTEGYQIWRCDKCLLTEKRAMVKSDHNTWLDDPNADVKVNPRKDDISRIKTTATCTKAGTSDFYCKYCGKTWTEDEDKLGHDFGPDSWNLSYNSTSFNAAAYLNGTKKYKVVQVLRNCMNGDGLLIYCYRGCGATKYLQDQWAGAWAIPNPAAHAPYIDSVVYTTDPDKTVVTFKCHNSGCPYLFVYQDWKILTEADIGGITPP